MNCRENYNLSNPSVGSTSDCAKQITLVLHFSSLNHPIFAPPMCITTAENSSGKSSSGLQSDVTVLFCIMARTHKTINNMFINYNTHFH